MKHAGDAALDKLESVLNQLRKHGVLTERKRGVFYRGSSALLHFHEDPAGLFADVKTDADWLRVPVNTRAQQRDLLARIRTQLRGPD
jgi:hypothetical protein